VAEIAFGAHAGRIKRDGVVEALDGLVDFLLTRQHHAQIVVGVSVIRVGIDRKAILRIGFVEVILRCQSEAGDLVSPREAQPFTAPKTRELPDEAFSQCFALLHRCIAASLHRPERKPDSQRGFRAKPHRIVRRINCDKRTRVTGRLAGP
jgi:hypothetical protein